MQNKQDFEIKENQEAAEDNGTENKQPPLPPEQQLSQPISLRSTSGVAFGLTWALTGLLMLATVAVVISLWDNATKGEAAGIYRDVLSLVRYGCFIAALLNVTALLRSVKIEPSPFTQANVKRMKRVAFILGGFTVFTMLEQWFGPGVRKVMGLPVGDSVVLFNETQLVLLVATLVVYCFAMVFQRGVALQALEDETL